MLVPGIGEWFYNADLQGATEDLREEGRHKDEEDEWYPHREIDFRRYMVPRANDAQRA